MNKLLQFTPNEKLLAIIRALIGAREFPKKKLARRCGVPRPDFSRMIHGDMKMPDQVRDKLLSLLCEEKVRDKILLSTGVELPGAYPQGG